MADMTYIKRMSDRREGRLLRTLPAAVRIVPYIRRHRSESCAVLSDSVEVTGIEDWLREKQGDGWSGLSFLHLLIAAYVRTVSQCPGLNRFIGGQKIYARNNIEVVMAVKKTLTADGDETTIKIIFEPTDTVFDVYRKLNEKVDEIKASDGDNNTEQVAGALIKTPGLILKFAIWFLNLLDYFGLLPQVLLDASPFHGSMIITDLGSLGIPAIYHHLYNFGNLPIFLSFGAKRRAVELDKSGAPVERKYVDYKVVVDERTVDGFYYAAALKYLKYYLKNPAALEAAPESVKEDIF